MDLSNAKVGDEFILVGAHRKGQDELRKITKVGRKYVYVEVYGKDTPFHKESGFMQSNYSTGVFLTTEEQRKTELIHQDLMQQIRDKGWGPVNYDRGRNQSIEQLRAILEALESG